MSVRPPNHGQELVRFVHGLRLQDTPADVVDGAKACLLDALGCGIFGSGQPWSRILADEMLAEGSTGNSTVIGHAQPVSALWRHRGRSCRRYRSGGCLRDQRFAQAGTELGSRGELRRT